MEIAGERRRRAARSARAPPRSGDARDRDGPVQRHDGRRLHMLERLVEKIDLRPVGILRPGGAGMQRRDRRLDQIGAGPAMAHRLVDQRQPSAIIAAFQRLRSWSSSRMTAPSASKRAARRECCSSISAVQAHDLRLGGEQAGAAAAPGGSPRRRGGSGASPAGAE